MGYIICTFQLFIRHIYSCNKNYHKRNIFSQQLHPNKITPAKICMYIKYILLIIYHYL